MDFPRWLSGKESASVPGIGKILWNTKWQPTQHSCLENPMDRGVWQATVQGSQRVRHNWTHKAHPVLCHVQMWELDHKEGWVLKNWCFWIAVLEKTLESPLDCKEIKPVNPKGNQTWIFIGRTDSEPEATIFESQLTGKNLDAGKDWKQKKRAAEDKMVRKHHWLNGYECEQTLGASEGQGTLACCSYGVARNWTWLSNWTTKKKLKILEGKTVCRVYGNFLYYLLNFPINLKLS